jgi:hypothetical protein
MAVASRRFPEVVGGLGEGDHHLEGVPRGIGKAARGHEELTHGFRKVIHGIPKADGGLAEAVRTLRGVVHRVRGLIHGFPDAGHADAADHSRTSQGSWNSRRETFEYHVQQSVPMDSITVTDDIKEA